MNCNGYMGTLDMLAKARSSLQNHAAYLAINKAMCNGSDDTSSCDIERSILNYTKDCTVKKAMSPTERFTIKNVTGFKVNGDTQKELKYNSKRHYTKVYAGPGKDGVMNCLEAGNFIATAFENNSVKTTIYNMAFPHHNLTTTGGSVNDGGSGTDNGTREGTYDVAAMQTDMDAVLGGLGSQTADSYEYLKNVLIRPLMEKGFRDGFLEQNLVAAQISLDTAISQRNLQLAAESSMFATMIRPLTTFLEGFVLALTPLMPFILLLGINAFGVVMKYLLVLFWIQLWAPALAICNMYVQNVVKENLALALGGTDITSFTGIETATPVIQHWLAVGGMMGASVPVLTLFILSGSIYTFNTLATSIKGGDHFDEKAIQPDAIKRAAYINTSVGSYNISSGAGSTEDGTSSAYAKITSSEIANVAESVAHAEKVAKQNQFVDSVVQGMSHSTNAQHNRSIVSNIAKQWAAKDSDGYQEVTGKIKQAFSSQGITLTDATAGELFVGATLAGKAKFGWSAKKLLKVLDFGAELSAGLQGSGDKKWTDTEQSTFAANIMDTVNKNLSGSQSKSLEDAISDGLTTMDQKALTKGFQSVDTHNVTKSFNEMRSAEDTYNKVSTNTSSYDKTKSYGTNELAGQILKYEPEKRDQLLAWMDKNKDFTRGIINSSYGKGKAPNTTGVFASLIEYAKFNENDKEAHELLNIMQLDDYLGKGVANNGIDTSDTLKVAPINRNGGSSIDGKVQEGIGNIGGEVNNEGNKLEDALSQKKNDGSVISESNKLNNQYKDQFGKTQTAVNGAAQVLNHGVRNAWETQMNNTDHDQSDKEHEIYTTALKDIKNMNNSNNATVKEVKSLMDPNNNQ